MMFRHLPLHVRHPDPSRLPTADGGSGNPERESTSPPRVAQALLRLALVAGIGLVGLSNTTAWAAENRDDEDAQDKSRWGLGLGVGVLEKAYRDIDGETIFRPIIIYDSKWFSIQGGTLGLKLPDAGPFSFGLELDFSNDGYDASDSDFLTGMEDREDEFWAGASLNWENRIADVSASWSTDVSGNSDGQKFSVSVGRSFERGNFEFTPSVGAVWLDDNYVDYFYGVRAEEATAERAFYSPESTVNLEAGFRTTYRVGQRHSVFLDLSVSTLGSEIEDSPIVDGSTDSRVFVGYVRMF